MPSEKYIVNKLHSFQVNDLQEGTLFNDTEVDSYIYLYKEKNYKIKILEKSEKSCKLKINGYILEIDSKTALDEVIASLGYNTKKSKIITDILSPMTGVVKKIMVTPGAIIEAGDNLIILEAMKMENIIKAIASGTISAICVQEGDKVEKGKILIKL
jgi:biotin carboxyl carrier protein